MKSKHYSNNQWHLSYFLDKKNVIFHIQILNLQIFLRNSWALFSPSRCYKPACSTLTQKRTKRLTTSSPKITSTYFEGVAFQLKWEGWKKSHRSNKYRKKILDHPLYVLVEISLKCAVPFSQNIVFIFISLQCASR